MMKIKKLIGNLFGLSSEQPIKPPSAVKTVELDAQPDAPEDFGLKINWFAVNTSDIGAVLKALDFGAGRIANWSSGVQAAYSSRIGGYDKDLAFITPPIDGWVMVAGASLPYPVMHTADRHDGIGSAFDILYARLGACFPEVHFFGSYRGVGFVAWARMHTGEISRMFAFGDGEVYANIGLQTAEEAALGLPELNGLSLEEATARMFEGEISLPDEEAPLLLAELWSLNPGKLTEMALPPTCGVVVELPDINAYQ
jgi:hypothetical protein